MRFLYGYSMLERLRGVKDIIKWSVIRPPKEALPALEDDAAEDLKKS